jgi:hypothetical protein
MIEIVSLHILKTGGMSFLELLREEYGNEHVYHYIEKDSRFVKLKRALKLRTIPSRAKVIHGHFIFEDVRHIVEKDHPKVIVWFRDPIKRVVSRYHYLMKNISENANHPKLAWKNDTLLEFAQRPSQINVMSRFIKGIELEDLFFFGFLERFDEDLSELATKLGWEHTKQVHANSNADYLSKVNTELDEMTRKKLEEINQLDMQLYHSALTLKGIHLIK